MSLQTDASNQPFWMVWNPQGRAPTVRHLSNNAAIAEAERLARQCPSQQFFVLIATEMRCVDNMKRVRLWEVEYDETPF